jgi:hypothetical protein
LKADVEEGVDEEAMGAVGRGALLLFDIHTQGEVCLAYFATCSAADVYPLQKARFVDVFG